MGTAAELDAARLVERFTLKALVESCLVLEEGIATVKDIDLGMMAVVLRDDAGVAQPVGAQP